MRRPHLGGPHEAARDLKRSIVDERSGEVVFVSHCLLNQNTRYLGGAVRPGVVEDVIGPYLASGTGIVQMPCPEQRMWGGVLKRRLLWFVVHPRVARLVSPLVPLARGYTRRRCALEARRVADDIHDYLDSGYRVRGVHGVAGSPSCGVRTTLDLGKAATALGRCPYEPRTASWMNDAVVKPSECPGRGLFIAALAERLEQRHDEVALLEADLGDLAVGFRKSERS